MNRRNVASRETIPLSWACIVRALTGRWPEGKWRHMRSSNLVLVLIALFFPTTLGSSPPKGRVENRERTHLSVAVKPRDKIFNGDVDLDRDGLPDSLEQELAEKYAPIVIHDPKEPNLPTNVKLFLPQTELWFYDDQCKPKRVKISDTFGQTIPHRRQPACVASEGQFDSHGTRSRDKQRSFFLRLASESPRRGSVDPRNWTTYYHAYPNDGGGVTIQYWRFYAYNTGMIFGFKTSLGSHEGDWEAIHIVLDARHQPLVARFLGHRSISTEPWSALLKEGDHLLVKSEKGGHTSRPMEKADAQRIGNFIRQETWSGGLVDWPANHPLRPRDSTRSTGGALVNIGEKTAPMNGVEFIQYSGLWGNRKSGGFLSGLRSGYWGPAYNETGMEGDFITAWCGGMTEILKARLLVADGETLRECYPTARAAR